MTVDTGDGAALVGAMIDEMRELCDGLDLNARAQILRGRGYLPIGNFNGNPAATFFGEKRLSR